MFLCSDQCERAGFFDQLGQTFDRPLGFSPRHEIAKSADDLACPKSLSRCLFDCIGNPIKRRVLAR